MILITAIKNSKSPLLMLKIYCVKIVLMLCYKMVIVVAMRRLC